LTDGCAAFVTAKRSSASTRVCGGYRKATWVTPSVLREGISALRVDHGPGYRVYFMRRGPVVIVLLAGGDKRTQDADIARAIEIAKDWKE
jgi:putative addiction module killer protein